MTLSIPIRSRLESNRETVLTRIITIRWTMKTSRRKRRGKLVRRRRHIRRRRNNRRGIRNMRAARIMEGKRRQR
jgi:transposase